MRVTWIDTDKTVDLARPDALRMIRRGRALLARDEISRPQPMAAKEPPKPEKEPK